MITVITEHATLLTVKAGLHYARNTASAGTRNAGAAGVADAVNRALGDTHADLTTAIDKLHMGDTRLHARQAFTALEQDITELAHVDNILWAAALLPAHVDADDDLNRLRARREAITAAIAESTATLAAALADARVDLGA